MYVRHISIKICFKMFSVLNAGRFFSSKDQNIHFHGNSVSLDSGTQNHSCAEIGMVEVIGCEGLLIPMSGNFNNKISNNNNLSGYLCILNDKSQFTDHFN